MKVIYVIICLSFLDLSVCYGQNLSRDERKIGMSCDIKKGIVHHIPKFEVTTHVSNDTLYSKFINHSLDTVVMRLCTTVLEGSQVLLYRTKSEKEKPIVRKELYTLPFTNFLFFDPLESKVFPTKINGKNLHEANYVKYEFYYFLPSIRKGGIFVKWSPIQKLEKNILKGNCMIDSIDEQVYKYVTQMPEFPGGASAMLTYLRKNLRYPYEPFETIVSVVVKFVVEKDGSLSHVYIKRGADDFSLDKEALRIVKSMPKWTPGYKDGKPVRVYISIPVLFRW